MRILIINNSAMLSSAEGIFIYKETGNFINELVLTYTVENFQFSVPFEGNNNLANFNLKETPVELTVVKKGKNKWWAYLKSFMLSIKSIKKSDFIYLFYPNSLLAVLLVAVALKKPFGIYVRGQTKIMRWLEKFLFKKAKFILTISPAFTTMIKPLNSITETIAPMMPFTLKDLKRTREYSSKSVYSLLFVGRVERAKGIFDLINVCELLNKSGFSNYNLIVVGDGDDLNKARLITQEKKLNGQILFVGAIFDKETLATYYTNSDLFILPSYHEGFPRVLYEAMLMGTPILTTFVGSIPFLMRDGFNCYEIKVNNPSFLAEKIKAILKQYELVSGLTTKAQMTIECYLKENYETHFEKFCRLLIALK